MAASSYLSELLKQGQNKVTLAGWVNSRRDHGGLIFIDLRDFKGLVQLVFQPDNPKVFAQADKLRAEWVIEVKGELRARPQDLINAQLATGHLEVKVEEIRILNQSQTPPISVHDQQGVHEDKRLTYRYLDLRRPKMQAFLKLRAKFYKFVRDFMESRDFIEIPTPILANSSPEGARDFLVPSRLHPHKFYALPQAPQQFKQLLMVGGVARYYQIATCFRDEDPRADRLYGDFYQLDLEMSFVEDSQRIRQEVEPLVKSLITDFGGLSLYQNQIMSLTYEQALNDYGTDKPDLRFDLRLKEIGYIFKQTKIKVLADIFKDKGIIKALVAPGIFSRKQIEDLTCLVQTFGIGGLGFISLEKGEYKGSWQKFIEEAEIQTLIKDLDFKDGQTIFIAAHAQLKIVNQALGALRQTLGDLLNFKDDGLVAAAWIVDFPFYEEDDRGQLTFSHNPFSKPLGDLDQPDKLQIRADQFDLVLNGYEVCSGAARNHDPQKLTEVFKILGYKQEEIEEQFGALISAFKYGAPPHGGCAFGLDRLLMILAQEPNIRELVAFPKNGSGVDLMMSSPTTIDPSQRRELKL